MTGKTRTRKFKMESYDEYKKLIADFRVIDVRSGDIQDEYKRKSVGQIHYLINLEVREPYIEIYRILRPKEWGPQFTGDGYSRGKSPNKKELEDRLKEFFFRYLRKNKTPTGHSIRQLVNNFTLLKRNFLLSLEENDFNPFKNKKLEIKQKNGEFVEDKYIKQMIERVIKGRIDYIINNVLDVYYRERTLGDYLPSFKGYEEVKKKQEKYGMPGGKPITISDSKKLSDEEKDILRGWGVRFEEDEFNPFFNEDEDEPLHSSNPFFNEDEDEPLHSSYPFRFRMNDLFSLGRGHDEEEGEEDERDRKKKRKYEPREGETPEEYAKRLRKLRKKREKKDKKKRKKMTKTRRKSRNKYRMELERGNCPEGMLEDYQNCGYKFPCKDKYNICRSKRGLRLSEVMSLEELATRRLLRPNTENSVPYTLNYETAGQWMLPPQGYYLKSPTGDKVKTLPLDKTIINMTERNRLNKDLSNLLIQFAWESSSYNEDIKKLLELGVDVNIPDHDGDTALMAASANDNIEIVRLLLEAGANPNIHKTPPIQTPLMTASARGHIEIVRMLLDAGAKVETLDEDGWSAIMYARAQDNMDIVEMLRREAPRLYN